MVGNSFADYATLVLIQTSLLFSLSFLFWFGITRKWQADAFGVNLFLTALSTVLILVLAEIGLFWEDEPWRAWARVVGWGIFSFVWAQRLWFLVRDTKKSGRKDRE